MVIEASARRVATDHGKHIFIYNHITTNQVIYSLTRGLRPNRALKQLTFVGKKSVPSDIRRDLWRPLATVIFPSEHQGLSAYRKLREMRKLHEVAWETEPDTQPLPKKERIRMLMDQKANTIADLAAVLKIQERDGGRLEKWNEKRVEQAKAYVAKESEKTKSLAERADNGSLKVLEELEAKFSKRYEAATSMDRKKGLRDQLRACRRKIIAMRTAQKEMAALKPTEQSPEAVDSEASSLQLDNSVDLESDALETVAKMIRKKYGSAVPKRGWRRSILVNPVYPTVTLDGVTIKWADLTDAEYAEKWPEGVMHDIMGYAPAGTEAPEPSSAPRPFSSRVVNTQVSGDEPAARQETEEEPAQKGDEKENSGLMGRLRSVFGKKNPQTLDGPSA